MLACSSGFAAVMLTSCSSFRSHRCVAPRSVAVVRDLRPGESLPAILGVSQEATGSEIKAAFRRKVMVLHPDINPSPNALREFRRLVAAHEIISNPRKRSLWEARSCGCGCRAQETTCRPAIQRSSRLRPISYLCLAMYSCGCGSILSSLWWEQL